MEKALKNMEKTRSLARTLGVTDNEDNGSQSNLIDEHKLGDESNIKQQMTEDEQLAYALQLSMDD